MDQVLADNIRALMSANRPSLGTQAKVAAATGHVLNQTTVGRILRARHKVQLDTLAALARAFDIEPYQLLIPGLDPRNPQTLRVLSPAEEALYRALEVARKTDTV